MKTARGITLLADSGYIAGLFRILNAILVMRFFPISAPSPQMSTRNPLRCTHPKSMYAKNLTAETSIVLGPEYLLSWLKISINDCIDYRFLIPIVRKEGMLFFRPKPMLANNRQNVCPMFCFCGNSYLSAKLLPIIFVFISKQDIDY